jgi:hypothetical protein
MVSNSYHPLSFKNMSKYPKTDKFNYNDLVTSPNEAKWVLNYLSKPENDQITVIEIYDF